MLAVGTKLSVYPIAGVVPIAKEEGATVVILNSEPTEMDELADLILRGDADLRRTVPMVAAILTSCSGGIPPYRG